MPNKISYDRKANAVYIEINQGEHFKTEEIGNGVSLDYDTNKQLIGIEILNFSNKEISLTELNGLSTDELISRLIEEDQDELSDETLGAIKEGIEDYKKGNVLTFDEVKKQLDLK